MEQGTIVCEQCAYPLDNGRCGNPACRQDKDEPQQALIEAAQHARAQRDAYLIKQKSHFSSLYGHSELAMQKRMS